MMRILSGVQPSGVLHIGNYFGAIKQHIDMQEGGDAFIFIANYHALTTIKDGKYLRELVFDVAASYLALGLDPNKAVLFQQSDVPQVTELTWILSSVTGMGLMERGTSYKDKVANNISPSVGLFTYPILQAADILIYGSDVVPVGKDQMQHIEFCRDMATYLNNAYGQPLLKLPVHRFSDAPIVPGVDGRKMSKSYHNTLPIFEGGKALRKRVMAIKTDSTPMEDPKDPDTCNVFTLYKLFASPEQQAELAAKYRGGGFGYGHAKQALFEIMNVYFGESRERRAEMDKRPDDVWDVVREGGKKAHGVAEETMQRIREVVGVPHSR